MLFEAGHESLVCEDVAAEDVLVVVVERVEALDAVLAEEMLLMDDDDDDEEMITLEVDDVLALLVAPVRTMC